MYSFGPLPRQKRSGRHLGTHQKVDRIARRHLAPYLDARLVFPNIKDILHFEGSRGPDGIKLKSPGRDEPLHFIDPKKPEGELLEHIRNHTHNLKKALIDADTTRAAFEAAWLAHAVADGLTPAHHESMHEQIRHMKHTDEEKLRKVRGKVVMGGTTRKEVIMNNWQFWGAKGIMTSHTLFEAGIAVAAKPYKFKSGMPFTHDIESLENEGFEHVYVRLITEIAALDMYEKFKKLGWTNELARLTNKQLLPRVVLAITLVWYDAYMAALKEVHA